MWQGETAIELAALAGTGPERKDGRKRRIEVKESRIHSSLLIVGSSANAVATTLIIVPRIQEVAVFRRKESPRQKTECVSTMSAAGHELA